MSTSSPDISLGSPRFAAASADASSALPAWSALLDRHGVSAAAREVQGDFAVGLQRSDGSVFLAVDRFAQQTLCYRVDGQDIRFGERADDVAGSSADLDPQALFDYLFFHAIPSPRTIFKGVQRLPPGHGLSFDKGQVKIEPYWVPTFTPDATPSFAALKDEFHRHLREAVRRRLGGGKGACFLSGGTDSSTLAGLIAEVTGQPAATYSIGFEAEGYDEMAFARIAAKRFGCEHHEYYVTPDDLVKGMAPLAAAFDQPFGNSSALPAYHCALQARGDGVTQLLGGDGGDELFGGNTRYASQRIFDWYQKVPGALRSGLLEPFFGLGAVSRTPLLRKGSGYIRHAKTPLPDRLETFNLVRRLGYAEVLTPAFLAQVDTESVHQQQRDAWAACVADTRLDRHLAYDWRYTLAESDLPKVRGATGAAGMATGFPFLDDDLVAFSTRLPTEYKLKGKQLRWFFKEALRGFLPDDIITKKKQGFGLPFGVWVVKHPPLFKQANDALRSLAGRGLVQAAFIDNLMTHRMREHAHYYGTLVWILMTLEHWLQHHRPNYRVG